MRVLVGCTMVVSVNALDRAFSSTAVLIEPLLIPDSTFYLEVHAARVYCRRVYVRLVCVWSELTCSFHGRRRLILILRSIF